MLCRLPVPGEALDFAGHPGCQGEVPRRAEIPGDGHCPGSHVVGLLEPTQHGEGDTHRRGDHQLESRSPGELGEEILGSADRSPSRGRPVQHGKGNLADAVRRQGQVARPRRVLQSLLSSLEAGTVVAPEVVGRGDQVPGRRQPRIITELREGRHALLALLPETRERRLARVRERPQVVLVDPASQLECSLPSRVGFLGNVLEESLRALHFS